MLEVTFHRDARDRLAAISALGHADFADYGEDVVCAAVSAVLQAARLGLERHAGVELEARQKPGELRLVCPPRPRGFESVRAIFATAELAIEAIARRFPDHVRIARRPLGRNVGAQPSGRVTSLADRRRRHNV